MNRLAREQFLKANPVCIYCAGRSASEEPDHQPGRNFFDSRVWPEGYEFPACVPCNRATKSDESLVDLFARFPTCLDSRETMRGLNTRMVNVLKWFPDLYWALRMTENQRRHMRRARPGRVGVVMHFPEEFRYRFNRVAFKLGAALHWLHADHQIIPADGGCMVDILPGGGDPGLDHQGDEILRKLANMRANPVRNSKSLSDQFEYDYWSSDADVSLYAIRIRQHFRLSIGVFMGPSDFNAWGSIPGQAPKMVQPFDPAETVQADYHCRHVLPDGLYRWRVLQEIKPRTGAVRPSASRQLEAQSC